MVLLCHNLEDARAIPGHLRDTLLLLGLPCRLGSGLRGLGAGEPEPVDRRRGIRVAVNSRASNEDIGPGFGGTDDGFLGDPAVHLECRIVAGGDPPAEFYYTSDHYRSFRRLEPNAAR